MRYVLDGPGFDFPGKGLCLGMFPLEAIWASEKDCDRVLYAGDLVDYGPYPREVIAWIQAHEVQCVQGNHDAQVALNYRRGHTFETVPEEERAWAHHNAGLLSEAEVRAGDSLFERYKAVAQSRQRLIPSS